MILSRSSIGVHWWTMVLRMEHVYELAQFEAPSSVCFCSSSDTESKTAAREEEVFDLYHGKSQIRIATKLSVGARAV